MQISKNNIEKYLILFLITHLFIWTLIPSVSNNNLPLDTIEALAWGSNMDWGFNKHPPLSAFFPKIFYQIFGSKDWVYYFLSQLFVIASFFIVWVFSKEFFRNKVYALLSVLILEGIYFYNFTTPEFNVNVCQLPFWALSVLYCWRGFKNNEIVDWLLFGIFAALGVLSKYLFIYLLVGMDAFFIYMILKKKIDLKCLTSLITFFIILFPHLIWLTENNYITISYALNRTGLDEFSFFNHVKHPLIFLLKQIGILIPFFVMLLIIISKFKAKLNLKDKKLIFLLFINIVPFFLMFLSSVVMGVKIRTMWMTPFYLFLGVLFLYIFSEKIKLRRLKYFFLVFSIIFIISPISYLYISITQTEKRTDYPGKEMAYLIQDKWNNNFSNEIKSVIGDEWHAGNLSYNLKSKPKWYSYTAAFVDISADDFMNTIGNNGFIIVNGECSYGILLVIKNQNICMLGKK